MKYVFFNSIFCCFTIFSTFAQESKIKFGEISKNELEMKIYARDSSAEAVVLYDFGKYEYVYVYGSPHVIYNFHKRIKILKNAGLKRANVEVLFHLSKDDFKDDKLEVVRDIKGATYNIENGEIEVTDLESSSVFEDRSGSLGKTKIIFPKAKVGSVIEYSFTLDSQIWTALRSWHFQEEIPVVWSELRTKIPNYFDYKIIFLGYNEFAIRKSEEGEDFFLSYKNSYGKPLKDPFLSYQFAVKDLPALKEDEYITTIEDYRSSLNFELARTIFPKSGEQIYSKTYNDLTKTLLELEDYGIALKKFNKTAEKLSEKSLKLTLEEDSLKMIENAYEYIRKNMHWNEETGLLITQKLDKVNEKKSGNATEINFILIAILRTMGFDANPVILSTRSHGSIIKDVALLDKFNYTIVHIQMKGKDFLLDATDKYIKPFMLPKRCLNDDGWLLSKNPRWVSLIPLERKQINTLLHFIVEDNQKMKGKFSESYFGYAGAEKLEQVSKLGEGKFIEKLKNEYPTFENVQFSYKAMEDHEAIVECETIVNEAYSVAGSRMFIQPLLWKTQKTNPFKQVERRYPINLGYGTQEMVLAKYTIPQNYIIESLPMNKTFILPQNKGKFVYIVKFENGVIDILSQILLAKTTYAVDDYENLREFFNQIIAKQSEQIVLKKN